MQLCSHAASYRQYRTSHPHTRNYCQQSGADGAEGSPTIFCPESSIHFSFQLTKVLLNVNSLTPAASMNEPKESLGLATRIYVRENPLFWGEFPIVFARATRLISHAQATRSAEDGLSHVDLNRNVEALYVPVTPRKRGFSDSVSVAAALKTPWRISRLSNSYEMFVTLPARTIWKNMWNC